MAKNSPRDHVPPSGGTGQSRRARKQPPLSWLATNPSLELLIQAFPSEWDSARRELERLLSRDSTTEMQEFLQRLSEPEVMRPGGRLSSVSRRASNEARRQMMIHLVKQAILRSTTGVSSGRVRFGLIQGWIAQRLLFKRDLERKPVSLTLFRLVWPLLRQRRLLMPLVQPRGIWCFYSSALIRDLVDIVGERRCLEIAAGDGTLARFLAAEGVDIVATDNQSWSDSIEFPAHVLKLDAAAALKQHPCEVVICSWPPAGNTFERVVFATPHVQTYIVIGSNSQVSTGNWDDYRRQKDFEMRLDTRLSSRVLPPEVGHGVLVFDRAQLRSNRS